MPDAVDVFLCHSGDDPLVKQLLDFVRRALHEVPPVGGGAPVCAFRDEDDLDGIGQTQAALAAAIRQAPIGAMLSLSYWL